MKKAYQFVFTARAFRQFQGLAPDLKRRIGEKLKFWQDQEDPLQFAKPTPQLRYATHRFRIGKFRVLCKTEKKQLVIVKMGLRDTVYKGA